MTQRDLDRLAARVQDKIDNDTEHAGVYLTPSSGDPEENLSQAGKAARIFDRSVKLADVVRAEPVRRMTRRAGLTSYATTAPDDGTDVVLKTLRQITDVVLHNSTKTKALTYLCDSLGKKVVTEDLLREALKEFDIKLFGACAERHSSCPSLKVRG